MMMDLTAMIYNLAILLMVIELSTSAPLRSDTAAYCDYEKRVKRSASLATPDLGNDQIGNPSGKSWKCTAAMGPSCLFKMPLTISISTFWHKTSILSQEKQREIVLLQAAKWQAVTTDLQIKWANPGENVNIDVFFAFLDAQHSRIGQAGDPAPDEPGMSTFLRLDDAEDWRENWDTKKDEAYSLSWAVLHELGHALGLGHSSDSQDIMYSVIQRTDARLGPGDIKGIQALYGSNSPFVPPTVAPATVPPQTNQPPIVVPIVNPNPQPVNPNPQVQPFNPNPQPVPFVNPLNNQQPSVFFPGIPTNVRPVGFNGGDIPKEGIILPSSGSSSNFGPSQDDFRNVIGDRTSKTMKRVNRLKNKAEKKKNQLKNKANKKGNSLKGSKNNKGKNRK